MPLDLQVRKLRSPSGKQQAKGSGKQKAEAWLACRVSGLTHHLPPPPVSQPETGLGRRELQLEPRDLLPAKEGLTSISGRRLPPVPSPHTCNGAWRHKTQPGGAPGLGSNLSFQTT